MEREGDKQSGDLAVAFSLVKESILASKRFAIREFEPPKKGLDDKYRTFSYISGSGGTGNFFEAVVRVLCKRCSSLPRLELHRPDN